MNRTFRSAKGAVGVTWALFLVAVLVGLTSPGAATQDQPPAGGAGEKAKRNFFIINRGPATTKPGEARPQPDPGQGGDQKVSPKLAPALNVVVAADGQDRTRDTRYAGTTRAGGIILDAPGTVKAEDLQPLLHLIPNARSIEPVSKQDFDRVSTLVVQLREGADAGALAIDEIEGLVIVRTNEKAGYVVVGLRDPESGFTAKQVLALDATEAVATVEPNAFLYLTSSAPAKPNDPYYKWSQWGLKDLEASFAWNKTTSASIVVAIIDSGVGYMHPDVRANMWENVKELEGQSGLDDDGNGVVDDVIGYDFLGDGSVPDANPNDVHGHGTHAAGIIAGIGNNGIGISGIVWQGKIIMAVRAFSGDGRGEAAHVADAIRYAVDSGAKVLNMSWGGHDDVALIREAIRYARDRDVLCIAAAGNSFGGHNENDPAQGSNDIYPFYPASYSTHAELGEVVVAVASYGDDTEGMPPDPRKLSPFSRHGKTSVTLLAPGVYCWSTVPPLLEDTEHTTYSYAFREGTSSAAAHVAGAAALWWSLDESQSASAVKKRLVETVHVPPGPVNPFKDLCVTGGRLDLKKLFQ